MLAVIIPYFLASPPPNTSCKPPPPSLSQQTSVGECWRNVVLTAQWSNSCPEIMALRWSSRVVSHSAADRLWSHLAYIHPIPLFPFSSSLLPLQPRPCPVEWRSAPSFSFSISLSSALSSISGSCWSCFLPLSFSPGIPLDLPLVGLAAVSSVPRSLLHFLLITPSLPLLTPSSPSFFLTCSISFLVFLINCLQDPWFCPSCPTHFVTASFPSWFYISFLLHYVFDTIFHLCIFSPLFLFHFIFPNRTVSRLLYNR